jgi:hypothetical protein
VDTTQQNSMDLAFTKAWNSGIFVAVAAGNEGMRADGFSPAHAAKIKAVGSYGTSGKMSSFSTFSLKTHVWKTHVLQCKTFLKHLLFLFQVTMARMSRPWHRVKISCRRMAPNRAPAWRHHTWLVQLHCS